MICIRICVKIRDEGLVKAYYEEVITLIDKMFDTINERVKRIVLDNDGSSIEEDLEEMAAELMGRFKDTLTLDLSVRWQLIFGEFMYNIQSYLDVLLQEPMEFYNQYNPHNKLDLEKILLSVCDEAVMQLNIEDPLTWLPNTNLAQTRLFKFSSALLNDVHKESTMKQLLITAQLLGIILTARKQSHRTVDAVYKDLQQLVACSDLESKVYSSLVKLGRPCK